MGIYQRADSPYWWMHVETAPKGARDVSTKIRIGVTAEDRKQSRALAETLYHTRSLQKSAVLQGLPSDAPAAPPLTFATFATWYAANELLHHAGAERERTILPRLIDAFGDLALTDPTWKTRALEWRTARRATGTLIKHFGGPQGPPRQLPPPSARTVNREMDFLQQILAAAVKAGHLETSPLFGLEDLDIVEPVRRTMSEAEEQKLAQELSPEDYAILRVGLEGLARMINVLDLKRSDDHGDTFDVRDTKNGTSITVPLGSRLRAALDAVPVDPDHPEWYFPGRRGAKTARDRRNGYAKALQRACQRAGVPYGRACGGITYHWATRRTGATRMIRRGGEKAIKVVQQIGGWKDPTVLIGIYQETITDEMRAAVESVSAGLPPLPPARPALTLVRARRQIVDGKA